MMIGSVQPVGGRITIRVTTQLERDIALRMARLVGASQARDEDGSAAV